MRISAQSFLLIVLLSLYSSVFAQSNNCKRALTQVTNFFNSEEKIYLHNGLKALAILEQCQSLGIAVYSFLPVERNIDWIPITYSFDNIDMVLVPPGCFLMGSESENNVVVSRLDEQPVHKQCFETFFWIDRLEVSREQYEQCVRAGACAEPLVTPSRVYRESQPITRITWFDAQRYCEWRNARLPTEAEWEYAARGPDGLVYPWGNEFIPENVVYAFDVQAGLGAGPHDVGTILTGVSWVGAFDLSGNVWEWVSSLYAPYPYKSDDGRENLRASGNRIIRGGGWYDFDSCDRAANRVELNPWVADTGNGFRCVR